MSGVEWGGVGWVESVSMYIHEHPPLVCLQSCSGAQCAPAFRLALMTSHVVAQDGVLSSNMVAEHGSVGEQPAEFWVEEQSGDCYRYLAELATVEAKSKVVDVPVMWQKQVPVIQKVRRLWRFRRCSTLTRSLMCLLWRNAKFPPFKLYRKRWKCNEFNFSVE